MKNKNRSGIICAGNYIIDHIKVVENYPKEEMLTSILSESKTNGGGGYNVVKNLALLNSPFPLSALGMIGNDNMGDSIIEDCRKHGIDTSHLSRITEAPTSYTDVMNVLGTGRRTFFHNHGANALLKKEHFQGSYGNAKILHLGYLMLLDSLDTVGPNGRTEASFVLEEALKAGLITSVDLVSVDSLELIASVFSALPFVDYLFLNEIEAGLLCDSRLRVDREIQYDQVEKAAEKLLEAGVRNTVIIHFEEGAYALNKNGQSVQQASLSLPDDWIAGATGAGDAFATGVLWELHESGDIAKGLELGVATAAASLTDLSPSGGVRSREECKAIFDRYAKQAAAVW